MSDHDLALVAELKKQIAALTKRVHGQAQSLRQAQLVAERHNVELDALHYVWCTGACPGGTHRYDHGELTEAIVVEAERNTRRLRTRWDNLVHKAAWHAAHADCKPDPAAP